MGISAAATNLGTRGRTALARRFGIDTRALAAFRIFLGLLLLSDLVLRSRDLTAFYTDSGVLPQSVLETRFPGLSHLSIHTISGAAWFQAVLFIVAAIFALLLLVGYRTRVSTAISFVLLVSLHARNPVLLNAGDSLLRRLLLWGIFLPLGERWSVDSLYDEGHGERVVTLASVGLLVQVVVIYTANALFKLRGELWMRGVAVEYVFSLHNLTTFVGDALARYPTMLHAFDKVWFTMIVTSALLILLAGWSRAAFASLFIGMHFGMFLTMHLGLFPLISITALLPFLPSVVWDSVDRFVEPVVGEHDEARWMSWCERVFPHPRTPKVPNDVRQGMERIAPLILTCLLVFVLVWNAATLGYVRTPEQVEGTVNPAEHRWSMFAPEPRGTDGWYVVPGRLESGEEVDAFHQSAVRWDRPSDEGLGFPSHRWLVYLLDLQRPGYETLRPAFAEYVCQRWNETHDDDLTNVSVYYVRQPTKLDGPEPTERVEITNRSCRTRNRGTT